MKRGLQMPIILPMPRPAWITAVVVAAAVPAGSAHASRTPSPGEQAALRRTISAYVRSKTPEVTRFQIRSARISTVDQTWAAVRIEAWRRKKDLGPTTVVLHDGSSPGPDGNGVGQGGNNGNGHGHGGDNGNGKGTGNGKHGQPGGTTTTTTTTTIAGTGTSSWHVVAFGSVSLGCGLPSAVQTDLHLACN